MSKATPSGQESAEAPSIKDREHFAISVPTRGIAVVENHKHDDPTTYSINVAQDGETSACSCPADEYHPGKCKHRQAVESEPSVLLAALADREGL